MKRLFAVLIIILFLLVDTNKVFALTDGKLKNHVREITLIKENKEIEKIKEKNIINIYDTLMLNMDDVFSKTFEEYQVDIDEQIIIFKSMTLEIKKSENIIRILDIYNVDQKEINNSVDIEIEAIDGIEYIPIYLIVNIPSIEILINNEKFDKYDSIWKEEADKRIEKYRKNNTDIKVKNQNGKEIRNAMVSCKMNNNEFKFGTAIRMAESTKSNKFTGIGRNIFNSLGSENGFKWPVLANNGSKIPKEAIAYALQNDMYIRGHALWADCLWADTETLIGNMEQPKENTMAYIYTNYNNGNITYEKAKELINNLKNIFEDMILNHIEKEMTEFPEINEWDVINEVISQQYFKYYLYDEKMLSNNRFLETTRKYMNAYADNEEYYQFLAKCFDKAREINQEAKLVINDEKINGDLTPTILQNTIKSINGIKKYTNNIDALGVQYHVGNRNYITPQSYYNQINYVLEQTGLKEAVVTEYDNYTNDKLNKYTKEEREQKAEYLRDTLIAQYSNPNVSGFNFWVYNSGTGSFVEEEWQAYEELMKEWLNDEQNGKTDSNGNYSARLYKGEYTAKVKINNLEKEVPIIVSDNTEPVEIIINSNLEKISIKQKPNKIEYVQDKENFDAGGGVILAHYDDGTVEEIDMSSNEVEISKLNNSILGKQTIIVTYKDKKVTFVVDVVEQNGKRPVVDPNEEISEISIIKLPEKVEYIQNKERMNLMNGKLLIKYKDGTTKEISMNDKDVSVSGFDNSIIGERAIRITYKGKQTTFVVYIVEDTSSSDDTIANKNLPNAGIRMTIIIGIFIIGVMAVVSGKKYIQYLKDTHKQLK